MSRTRGSARNSRRYRRTDAGLVSSGVPRLTRRRPVTGTAVSAEAPPRLLQLQKLDLEQQGRVRRDNAAGAARAVAQLGRDQQRPLAAHLHAGHAFVPTLDHLAATEPERERAAPVQRAVELRPLG